MTLSSNDSLDFEPLPEEEGTYEQRLEELRKLTGETNQAIEEIERNMKFINENEAMIKEIVEPSQLSCDCILLDHTNHREFIESVVMAADFVNNSEQHAAARKAMNYPQLKSQIDHIKTCLARNEQQLNQLDEFIASLHTQQATINELVNSEENKTL